MSRRIRWPKQPPPGLRKKLTRSQRSSVFLIHEQNAQDLATGRGTPQLLYDHLHCALTWLIVAKDLAKRDPETFGEALTVMQATNAACDGMIDRFKATGAVGCSGPELLMAREAVPWMDALAEVVDEDMAIAAGLAAIQALDDIAPLLMEAIEA